jgi:hypothetical protein
MQARRAVHAWMALTVKFVGAVPLQPNRAVPSRCSVAIRHTALESPVFLIIGYVIILAASLGTYAVHGSLAALWVPAWSTSRSSA